jgi:hypothetical protein
VDASLAAEIPVRAVSEFRFNKLASASQLWHDVAMTPRLKNVLVAVFWFVIGHISCAVMHHWHDIAGK